MTPEQVQNFWQEGFTQGRESANAEDFQAFLNDTEVDRDLEHSEYPGHSFYAWADQEGLELDADERDDACEAFCEGFLKGWVAYWRSTEESDGVVWVIEDLVTGYTVLLEAEHFHACACDPAELKEAFGDLQEFATDELVARERGCEWTRRDVEGKTTLYRVDGPDDLSDGDVMFVLDDDIDVYHAAEFNEP